MAENTIEKLDADPEYQDAWTLLQRIKGERDRVERELTEAHSHRATVMAERGKSKRKREAEALLAGKEPGQDSDVSLDTLQKLERRRVLLREAVSIQEGRVEKARHAASKRIAEAMLPAYRELLEKMAQALVKLGALADEEEAFRDALQADGIAFLSTIRPMPLPTLLLKEEHSLANRWLRELLEHYGIEVPAVVKAWKDQERTRASANEAEAKRRAGEELARLKAAEARRKKTLAGAVAKADRTMKRILAQG